MESKKGEKKCPPVGAPQNNIYVAVPWKIWEGKIQFMM
jgi:hypothetical protein